MPEAWEGTYIVPSHALWYKGLGMVSRGDFHLAFHHHGHHLEIIDTIQGSQAITSTYLGRRDPQEVLDRRRFYSYRNNDGRGDHRDTGSVRDPSGGFCFILEKSTGGSVNIHGSKVLHLNNKNTKESQSVYPKTR